MTEFEVPFCNTGHYVFATRAITAVGYATLRALARSLGPSTRPLASPETQSSKPPAAQTSIASFERLVGAPPACLYEERTPYIMYAVCFVTLQHSTGECLKIINCIYEYITTLQQSAGYTWFKSQPCAKPYRVWFMTPRRCVHEHGVH